MTRKILLTGARKTIFIIGKVIDEDDGNYTKLFICSQLMKAHFKAYDDVVIVDSTYRVNRYKLPIVLFSGFTHSERNCLFGIGVVNDETENTYNWLFSSFFRTHRNMSKIIVADHNFAMESVLNSTFPSITHLLEMSDFIEFLKGFEKKFISEETDKETLDQYGSHPIILELKKSLSSLIFSKIIFINLY